MNNKAIIAGVVIVIVLVVIFMSTGSKQKQQHEKNSSEKNSTSVSKDLRSIKSRINSIEKYRMREYYRSETNNGLTIAGTILEQLIDVAAAVFEQPLVHELTQKLLNKKEDAAIFAEYIELFGAELAKKIKKYPLLKCRTPLIEECTGDGEYQMCTLKEDPNAENKTSDCKAYRPRKDSVEKIAVEMFEFYKKIVTDSAHQSKLYPPIKNVIIDNFKMYAAESDMTDEEMNRMNQRISEFPEEKEFWEQLARPRNEREDAVEFVD
jgi:uncharacterized membrane-anchored protein YjiN (DUF445 family)